MLRGIQGLGQPLLGREHFEFMYLMFDEDSVTDPHFAGVKTGCRLKSEGL